MNVAATNDFLQTFLIDHSHIRGQLVRLGPVVTTILSRHKYPAVVSHALAECLVVAAMLSANLKSGGVLTLQAKGNGALKMLLVDATANGGLRAYAELAEGGKFGRKKQLSLAEMMGQGYFAITLDTGGEGGRYQGVVDLPTTSIAEAIRHYFTQSQQVRMDVKLAVQKANKGEWLAAGIMIESLPQEGGVMATRPTPEEMGEEDAEHAAAIAEAEDTWRRNALFMETVKAEELLGEDLTSWNVIERLFSQDGVWAYPPRALAVDCRCDRERISQVLSSLDAAELESMLVDGKITIVCQFCTQPEVFDKAQIQALFPPS